MIIVINNSNRNKEVLSNLRKSKRMMGSAKKCVIKKTKKNMNNVTYNTDMLIDFLQKNKIPFRNITSSKQMKKILKEKDKVTGIILSGSNLKYSSKLCACSINNNIISLLEFDVPILGICFGYQTLGIVFGGNVKSLDKMVNAKKKTKLKKSRIFKGMKNEEIFKYMHGDYIDIVPNSFKVIARTSNRLIQGIEHREREIYGVQFHPENSGKVGEKLLKNFIKICKI